MSVPLEQGSFQIINSRSVYFLGKESDIWYQGMQVCTSYGDFISKIYDRPITEVKIVRSSNPNDERVGMVTILATNTRLIRVDPTQDLGEMPDYT